MTFCQIFSFGKDSCCSTRFNGWGYFFVNINDTEIGTVYAHFFFQSSFATTATTIVSGKLYTSDVLRYCNIMQFNDEKMKKAVYNGE